MCFALGNYVTELKRISIGSIELLNLKPGDYRFLSEHEIEQLQKL
jgi:16S rRNA U516 pseudouridylate synthase RsuA-like enzyme